MRGSLYFDQLAYLEIKFKKILNYQYGCINDPAINSMTTPKIKERKKYWEKL